MKIFLSKYYHLKSRAHALTIPTQENREMEINYEQFNPSRTLLREKTHSINQSDPAYQFKLAQFISEPEPEVELSFDS
tara:strand:- start:149 stop:382 length:234 start_codon:yes stop_codon:yes gene_type:complete